MRGKLIQGEGSSASIFVKDESGVFVNPEIFPMIEVHLVEVLGYTTLAKYSNPSKVGYLPIEFDERLNPNTNHLQ